MPTPKDGPQIFYKVKKIHCIYAFANPKLMWVIIPYSHFHHSIIIEIFKNSG
jgi:hypothetical protein